MTEEIDKKPRGVGYSIGYDDEGQIKAKPEYLEKGRFTSWAYRHDLKLHDDEKTSEKPKRNEEDGVGREEPQHRRFSVSPKGEFKFLVKKNLTQYSEEKTEQYRHRSERYDKACSIDEDGVKFEGTTEVHYRYNGRVFPRPRIGW